MERAAYNCRVTRLPLVALLLLLAVAVGFRGGAPTSATGTCRFLHTGTGIDYGNSTRGLDAEMPDGSFVLSSLVEEGKAYVTRLTHVLPNCRVVSRFGIHSKSVNVEALAATPDGRILVAGGIGGDAVVGRLFVDGSLDRSFGTNGWARFRPGRARCEQGAMYYSVASLAVGHSGTIVLGGVGYHFHCTWWFASELTPDGRLVRTFGRDGSVYLGGGAPSVATEVFANSDRSVYAFGQWAPFGSCAGPQILRMYTDGSFDARFDKRIEVTVDRVAKSGGTLCFAPTLVPDGTGGFTLVGGLDRETRHPTSSGVSVRADASGRRTSGLTHFPSPGGAFDSPTTIRLPSGRILAAGTAYTRGGLPTRVLVQVFGRDGSRDHAFGDHGMLRYPVPPGMHTHWMSVDLLPAPNGGAWLLTGFRHEYDLTLLPVQ